MVIKFKKIILNLIEGIFFKGRTGLDNADEALRYLPISDEILKCDLKDPKILEVGSGVKGITPYIPFKITGVDVTFNGDIAENLEPVCLSGTNLPFTDKSYDYVISVDMLEHVPARQRHEVISELIRVASKKVFLAVPCGKAAEKQDNSLDEFYFREKGERNQFLQEHVDNGLPSKEELESCLLTVSEIIGVKIRLRVVPNVNLKVRNLFMHIWIRSKPGKLSIWISPFLCIFRRFLNSGECYRQIFILDVEAGG